MCLIFRVVYKVVTIVYSKTIDMALKGYYTTTVRMINAEESTLHRLSSLPELHILVRHSFMKINADFLLSAFFMTKRSKLRDLILLVFYDPETKVAINGKSEQELDFKN